MIHSSQIIFLQIYQKKNVSIRRNSNNDKNNIIITKRRIGGSWGRWGRVEPGFKGSLVRPSAAVCSDQGKIHETSRPSLLFTLSLLLGTLECPVRLNHRGMTHPQTVVFLIVPGWQGQLGPSNRTTERSPKRAWSSRQTERCISTVVHVFAFGVMRRGVTRSTRRGFVCSFS